MTEIVNARGLLFMADPHLADTPPGQRLEGYLDQVLDKVQAGLDKARELDMVPVFLGDLFHWPRDNSNHMLVSLMRMFAEQAEYHRAWVLVGNHDKYLTRFTDDVSLAVLETAGVVHIMKEAGPQFRLRTPDGDALVLACPDGYPLPKKHEPQEGDPDPESETVILLTHHNIRFPEFLDRAYDLRELPGIDWVVNGHIHRPQETVIKGGTTWANPGNITRLTFTRYSMERVPAAHIWKPGFTELEVSPLPHLRFDEIFPEQDLPPEAVTEDGGSQFIQGLERLAWRRTHEGVGLKQFLDENLDEQTPEGKLIWELYEEVIHGD